MHSTIDGKNSFMYLRNAYFVCPYKLILQDVSQNNIWMLKDHFVRKQGNVLTDGIVCNYLPVSTAQGLSISWPMENSN